MRSSIAKAAEFVSADRYHHPTRDRLLRSNTPGIKRIKPGACFQFVHFEYRRQKAKAAEFFSADHYPTKVLETLGHKTPTCGLDPTIPDMHLYVSNENPALGLRRCSIDFCPSRF